MNAKTIAMLAALVVMSSAAYSQSFEDQVSGVSAEVARQALASRDESAFAQRVSVEGAKKGWARTILCAKPPKESGLPEGLRFYTGLPANRPISPDSDDTAAKLNDNRQAYFKDGKFHYDAWSCDTQDYYFSFDAESLSRTGPNDKSRPVKGHARIETRGELDWEGDMDCVANF
jgi:hypothetical protein